MVRANQGPDAEDDEGDGNDGEDTEVGFTGEEAADLVDHGADAVRESALPADRSPGPLRVVHLTTDRTDRCKARCAEQVEGEEAVACCRAGVVGLYEVPDLVTCLGKLLCTLIMEEDTEGTNDILLGDETGYRSHCGLPVRPAERCEDPGDRVTDRGEDGVVHVDHAELTVLHTEGGCEPYRDGGQKDDGAGLLYEGRTTLIHGLQDVDRTWQVVCRKLHNERSRVTGEPLRLLQYDTGEDDRGDAEEVSRWCDPGCTAEYRTCEEGDDRELRGARDEGRGHDRHTTVTLVLDRSRCHDTRNAAAGADQHRDEGLTGETEATEDSIQDEGDTRHVSTALEEGEEEEQDEHLWQEAEHRTDTCDDTVEDETCQYLTGAECTEDAFEKARDRRQLAEAEEGPRV